MLRAMQYLRIFLPLYDPDFFALQRPLLAPTDGEFGTSSEAMWLIWCHVDLLVLSVRWALPVFLR